MSERAATLDPASRLLLRGLQQLPRGARLAINAWARRDPRLQDHPVPLSAWPERSLRLDLRTADAVELLKHGCYPYQLGEDQLCTRVLRAGDVVYDVGANVGYMTLMFLQSVGAGGQVHAFEPSPRNFATLQRSVEPGDPVQLTQAAVGAEPGEVLFQEYASSNLSSIAGFGTAQSQQHAPVTTCRVQTITLDDYWKSRGGAPQFVKIDVEGYEAQVLAGMRALLAAQAPILLFEANSPEGLAELLGLIRAARPGSYRFGRIAHDATLVRLGQVEGATNNYFGIPDWALPRFEGVALPGEE